ncbi:restriction endonuclease [Streptomyces sp.]|uniref:restriction endonuclease n=1 Tax=Streptomyces sp. TaxID=1931 RepID=UPI002D425E71|nr:restriction endonuclease [Streptomyces sp.]HZF91493.1 restriction endonuclease [Streptomyces sp.]
MAVPERPRRFPYRERPFDLRATAVFFGLSALVLVLAGLLARAAVDVAERRPAWVVILSLGGVACVLVWRRNRRRMSVSRIARRTTEALEEATVTALDALDDDAAYDTGRVVHAPGDGGGGDAEGGLGEATTVVVDYAALSADAFEQAIADLCVRDGCSQVQVVGGAGDLGADVVAAAPDGRRLVIQCKRYGADNKVGSQELQRFGGTCYTVHEADVAVVVTTSEFTAPAEEYAEQCGIVCVNHRFLRDWSDGLVAGPWAVVPGGSPGECG